MTRSGLISFRYRGVERSGVARRGTLEATDKQAAIDQLRSQQIVPLELVPTMFGSATPALSPDETATGLRVLADGMRAGLSVSTALELLDEFAGEGWKSRLPHLRRQLSEGRILSEALGQSDAGMPDLLLAMLRAGEASGELADALDRAAGEAQRSVARRRALQAALAYPALVAVSGTLSVVVMVGVVLPRFALILADFDQSLPPLTAAVLRAGVVAKASLVPVALMAVTAVVGISSWRSRAEGRQRLDAFWLRTPIVGPLRHASATAQACSALASLLDGGIPIRRALPIAVETTGDAELQRRARIAVTQVVEGHHIGSALAESGLFTDAATRLLSAGAATGRLAAMAKFAGQREVERFERRTQLGLKFAEPALITAFALVVAVIAVAMLQAVYAVRPV